LLRLPLYQQQKKKKREREVNKILSQNKRARGIAPEEEDLSAGMRTWVQSPVLQ
jgi:hypothetical protein